MPCRCLRFRRIPAVSTSTNVRSSVSSTVSIASRVVPGMSETMSRSCPSRALSRLDLPTFGLPSTATRIASSDTGWPRPPGRRSSTASSRSPVPWPWSAEISTGSPKPSVANSWLSSGRDGSSSLFATSSTGLRALRRMSVSSASPGVRPARASTRKSTRSASSIAALAWATAPRVIADSSVMSTPPVSTSRKRSPAHSQRSSLRSRVTPGVSWTTAARVAVSRLTSVDLPTFG